MAVRPIRVGKGEGECLLKITELKIYEFDAASHPMQLPTGGNVNNRISFKSGNVEATVAQADALAWLGQIKASSVDLIVTSPPYFVGKEYDVSRSPVDFKNEIRRVLPKMIRVLKPGGSLCWQVGNHVENGTLLPLDAVIINLLSKTNKLTLRNRMIWTFGHGTNATSRFSGRHETILWYTKGPDYFFDLDASRVPQLYPGKRHYKGPKKGDWSGNPLGKNPGDVWDIGDVWGIPNVKAKHIEKTEHPCQFPAALVRRLVVALSPLNGLVVDPYLGSGTSAVAALLEDRNFAGCDLEEKYVRIAETRLKLQIAGTLQVRPDVAIRQPKVGEAVSTRPPHFVSPLKVANG